MASTPAPLTAHAAALQRLGDLKGRLDLSARRWQQVQQLVPASMHTLVKPGACDDFDWCIVVAHAAAAAKLRHIVPDLEHALEQREGRKVSVRLRISANG
jgi:hypothetical protein